MYMPASSCSPFESVSVIPPSGVGDEETTFARYLIETWRERSAAVARWVMNSGFWGRILRVDESYVYIILASGDGMFYAEMLTRVSFEGLQ
jgi:hypothetical protein